MSYETGGTCKGCGKPIIWGTDPEGKRIPLDPRPPVYMVEPSGKCRRVSNAMVTHFATCPKAAEFSGKGKRK